MKALVRLLPLCLLFLGMGSSSAQVIGEEDVCANEPKGLYGLCIAYCNALKCATPTPRARGNACDKVLERYWAKSENGEDPPCVETPPPPECDCFSADDLENFPVGDFTQCTYIEDGNAMVIGDSVFNTNFSAYACASQIGGCYLDQTDVGPSCTLYIADFTLDEIRSDENDEQDNLQCVGLIEDFCITNGIPTATGSSMFSLGEGVPEL